MLFKISAVLKSVCRANSLTDKFHQGFISEWIPGVPNFIIYEERICPFTAVSQMHPTHNIMFYSSWGKMKNVSFVSNLYS